MQAPIAGVPQSPAKEATLGRELAAGGCGLAGAVPGLLLGFLAAALQRNQNDLNA